MVYSIAHPYQEQMLVPIAALHPNIDYFLGRREGDFLLCSDNIKCRLNFSKTMHCLEEEFNVTLQKVYGKKSQQHPWTFLTAWAARLHVTSLEFIYIECSNPEDISTSSSTE
jgi:hypothetical protein